MHNTFDEQDSIIAPVIVFIFASILANSVILGFLITVLIFWYFG